MSHSLLSSLRTASLLAVVAACGDTTGPSPHTGVYLLTEANGGPLPVLIGATLTCDQSLFKTVLSLATDGTFSVGAQVVSDCRRAGGGWSMTIVTLDGTYSASSGSLTLILASPARPIVGTYDASHVRVTFPAGPQTFPTAVAASFLYFRFPPP